MTCPAPRHATSTNAPWIPTMVGIMVRVAPTGTPSFVIPAKAGIHAAMTELGCASVRLAGSGVAHALAHESRVQE